MPIYEYQCDNCGHEQEAIQKFSDAPLTDCEDCGEPSLRRKISAAAFRLKGGGWYETDFKDGNRRNVIGGETSSANGSGSGESSGGSASEGGGKESTKESSKSSKDSGNKDTVKKDSGSAAKAASSA